jgi:hypothetical protein
MTRITLDAESAHPMPRPPPGCPVRSGAAITNP